MTTTVMKDSIVGDDWLRQTQANVPIQKIIDPATGNWNGDFLLFARAAFCDLLELPKPRPGQTSQPKFGSHLLCLPGTDFSPLYEEYYRLCGINFAEYYVAPQGGQQGYYAGLHSPFRDQAEKLKFGGFTPGCVFLNCTSKYKPPVVDSRMNPVVDPSKIYPGMWVIAAIKAYPFGKNPPQPKKGVAFGLQSVMIVGDDTRLGQKGPDAQKTFAGMAGRINAPVVLPSALGAMASLPAPGAPTPAAGIPGYTAPGGGVPTPGAVPHIPQQTWTPPQPAAATDDDDMSFLDA